MKAVTTVSALGFLVLLAAVRFGPAESAPQEQSDAQVKQAIMDRWDAYMATATEMDKEMWMSYWTSDAWLLEPGMNIRGSDFSGFADDFFGAGGQVFSLDLESHEVFVHGDAAYQIGQYDEAFQFPGEERMEAHNYFFARWVNVDGTWRIDRFLSGPREAPAGG